MVLRLRTPPASEWLKCLSAMKALQIVILRSKRLAQHF